MQRNEQIGRMILEASTGMHGTVARDIAQAWVALAERKQKLQERVDSLQTQLLKEAARTAEEKLRADQMTLQHQMQAQMHIDAACKLAAMKG